MLVYRYYFLASLLPPALTLGSLPEISFREFNQLCEQNLSEVDLEKTKAIRRYIDLNNLRAFWQGKELDPHGNYSAKELETHLLLEDGFPDYVFEFLRAHATIEERLDYFPKLLSQFYQEEIKTASRFVKSFFIFERTWRFVIMAMRAKTFKRDLSWELQYEDPLEEYVQMVLSQRELEDFTPPDGYEELKQIYQEFKFEPLKLHWEVGLWRLKKIEALVAGGTFSIDSVLSYLAQLIIAENWLKLNHDQGMNIVENIMKEQQV